jgi:hypothetical protein
LVVNALALGLSTSDLRQLGERLDPPLSAAELEKAISFKRIEGSAVFEVTVTLNDYQQAAGIVPEISDQLVNNARVLAESSGAQVTVAAQTAPDGGGEPVTFPRLRRAIIALLAGAVAAIAAALIAYLIRPTVLGVQTLAAATDLPLIARFTARMESKRVAITDPRVLVQKLALTREGRPIRLLNIVCGSPAEASLVARSAAVKRIARILGRDTLTLSTHGNSRHDVLTEWGALAQIGHHHAHLVLGEDLQSWPSGAATLREFARFRPIVLIGQVTPLALDTALVADATVEAVVAGTTRTAQLRSDLTDLIQIGAEPVGAVLIDA